MSSIPGLHSTLHHPASREWNSVHIHPSNLVYPVFVSEKTEDAEIEGFSPNKQWGTKNDYFSLITHLNSIPKLSSVMLFGVVGDKDPTGTMADHPELNPVVNACKALRAKLSNDIMILADVCLCEYTCHGHCGVIRVKDGVELIDNAATLERLSAIAVAYARAGAHYVCPSDMMDGRIASIRSALKEEGYPHVGIMAYSSKKASTLYAPFRNAVDSTFSGDRMQYQQPIGAEGLAMRAVRRDIQEGADVVIVKPSLFCGDLIAKASQVCDVPVAAYIVSGEYVMLTEYGRISGSLEDVVKEAHTGIIRAGASILITYFTPYILEHIHKW